MSFFALVVLHVDFVKLFGLQLFSACIDFHVVGQRKGNIEFDLFRGLFQADGKFTGLPGNTGHHGIGLDGNFGAGRDRFDEVANDRGNQAVVRIGDRQLFAPVVGVTAELRRFFNDGGLVAGLGGIQGGGHPGDPAADDQDLAAEVLELVRLGQRDLLDPRHSHFDVVFGQHLDAVEVVIVFFLLCRKGREFGTRVGPHDLLAQIDAVDDAAVKAEDIEIHPAGAGGDHQGVDALFADVFFE